MKKIIISLSVLLTVGLPAVCANNTPDPSQQLLDLFKQEFSTAQNVTWAKHHEFDKATFRLAGSWVVAYFNPAGEFEGAARDILYDQLPLAVMTAIDKRFVNASVSSVLEVSNSEGTSYRIVLKAKNKKYKIRVESSGNISDVEKLTR